MSDGLNDLFPGPQERPDVPEFWQLSEIVLKHDARAEEEGGLERTIEEFIPEEVASYICVARTAAMLMSDPMMVLFRMMRPDLYLRIHLTAAAAWNDGFCAGAAYQREYGKKVSG